MDGPNVLGMILEVSPGALLSSVSKEFLHVIESATLLVSVHMTSHRNGEVVVLAALPGRTALLYLSDESRTVSEIRALLLERLHNEITVDTHKKEWSSVALDKALGRFLLHINNRKRVTELVSILATVVAKRVIVFKLDADIPGQYNAIMNCIFAAKQENVIIDACNWTEKTSLFMKQATNLTNGIFLQLPNKSKSSEDSNAIILSAFSAHAHARTSLKLPLLDEIDFRSACRCHYPPRLLDQGFVCTICFSVYCDNTRKCSCSRKAMTIERHLRPTGASS